MRKINYEGLILLRKAQTGKRRGVARTRPYSTSAITNTPAPRRSEKHRTTAPRVGGKQATLTARATP